MIITDNKLNQLEYNLKLDSTTKSLNKFHKLNKLNINTQKKLKFELYIILSIN